MYIGSCSGVFYAFDVATGETLWSYDTSADGPPAQFHGDVLLTDDLVVVGSDARPAAHLYAFERESGEVRWKLGFPAGVAAQVLRHGSTALVVSALGEVLAVELATGLPAWHHTEPPEGLAGARGNDPALAGGRLFVPWRPGFVEAFDAADGRRLWRRDLGSVLNTSAAVVAGGVLVGDLDGRLHRLDPASGELVATWEAGGAFYGDLVPAGGCVLALRAAGGIGDSMRAVGPHVLECVEPDLSGVRWRHEAGREWSTHRPLVHDGRVVAGRDDLLIAVSLDGGDELWTRPIEGTPRGLGASPEHLYLGTVNGKIYALPWGGEAAREGEACGVD